MHIVRRRIKVANATCTFTYSTPNGPVALKAVVFLQSISAGLVFQRKEEVLHVTQNISPNIC